MLAQVYMSPSAPKPTSGIIGVHRDPAPDTFCGKLHFTGEIRKNGPATTLRRFIRLAQFDGPTCKTGTVRSLLCNIYHPAVMFTGAINQCRERISRRKTRIEVDGLKEIGEGGFDTGLCELPVFREALPIAVVGVQICSRLLVSSFNLRYLHMRHQLTYDARCHLVLKLEHVLQFA